MIPNLPPTPVPAEVTDSNDAPAPVSALRHVNSGNTGSVGTVKEARGWGRGAGRGVGRGTGNGVGNGVGYGVGMGVGSGTGRGIGNGAPRGKRLMFILVGAVVAVALVGGGLLWMTSNKNQGAVDAITNYLELVEAGKAEEASALVNPANRYSTSTDSFGGPTRPANGITPAGQSASGTDSVRPIDPTRAEVVDALVSDTMLASSAETMSITSITLDPSRNTDDSVEAGESLIFIVEYTLADTENRATIEVQRRADDAPAGTAEWTVLDSIAVPVFVFASVRGIPEIEINNSAVPTNDSYRGTLDDDDDDNNFNAISDKDEEDLNVVMMYPGVYEVTTGLSTYFSTPTTVVTVGHHKWGGEDGPSDVQQIAVVAEPTAKLQPKLDIAFDQYLADCTQQANNTPQSMAAECPAALKDAATAGKSIEITTNPTLPTATPGMFTSTQASDGNPRFSISNDNGVVRYTDSSGAAHEVELEVEALVQVRGDDIEITFGSASD